MRSGPATCRPVVDKHAGLLWKAHGDLFAAANADAQRPPQLASPLDRESLRPTERNRQRLTAVEDVWIAATRPISPGDERR